ncbi:MAG: hypothetical protein JSU05_08055 [Bacteroidetes bacterium]|nr:hypothetical protein [Bacteroidota bacterium]
MKYIYLVIVVLLTTVTTKVYAQGCIAIRSMGNTCTVKHAGDASSGWIFNANNRYYKSYKHFVGTKEQKQRVQQGTEVINHAYSLDLTLTRVINTRWSWSVDVPVLANTRSSKYEHYGNNSNSPNARQSTHSFGIGDVRVAGYYWLLNPVKSHRGNIQVGLGLKLATGDYKYQDFFHLNDSTQVLGPVDQSIQLGDGGTGFTTEVNAYYNFSPLISVYGNFYYLVNPREQNGTSTSRGGATSASSILYKTSTMSVPDQYMWRTGANFMVNNFTFTAGARMECLPVHDLIGGSGGFRRPGYIISAEPGVSYMAKKTTFYLAVPVALVRNRTQSVPDKIKTQMTGVYSQGDAAFADYAINAGITIRF